MARKYQMCARAKSENPCCVISPRPNIKRLRDARAHTSPGRRLCAAEIRAPRKIRKSMRPSVGQKATRLYQKTLAKPGNASRCAAGISEDAFSRLARCIQACAASIAASTRPASRTEPTQSVADGTHGEASLGRSTRFPDVGCPGVTDSPRAGGSIRLVLVGLRPGRPETSTRGLYEGRRDNNHRRDMVGPHRVGRHAAMRIRDVSMGKKRPTARRS
jgi:hypothetical protein